MRKYVIGAIFGFALAFSVTAHAEVVNMIGKVVDGAFSVNVNGKTLQNQAVVIEGTSYLPVREFGESLGMDVKFDANLGIELTQKAALAPSSVPTVNVEQKAKNAVMNAPSYAVKSTSLDISNGRDNTKVMIIDDNDYITANNALGGYLSFDGINTKFAVNSKAVSFEGAPKYKTGTDAFMLGADIFVRLSALGLKAEVKDSTLWIEKQ